MFIENGTPNESNVLTFIFEMKNTKFKEMNTSIGISIGYIALQIPRFFICISRFILVLYRINLK